MIKVLSVTVIIHFQIAGSGHFVEHHQGGLINHVIGYIDGVIARAGSKQFVLRAGF